MNYFKENIKYLLDSFDVSQSQLALQIGKKQQTVSNWVNGSSEPDVTDLLQIHHYFGISIDALVMENLKNGKIVTESHIQDFKRNGKVSGKNLGKVKPILKAYFQEDDESNRMLKDPDPVANWAIMGQFKIINEKLDQLRVSVENKGQKLP